MLTPEHVAEVHAVKNRLGRVSRDALRGNTAQPNSVISTDCTLLEIALKALRDFCLIQEQREAEDSEQ